jgi:hypothetical protein
MRIKLALLYCIAVGSGLLIGYADVTRIKEVTVTVLLLFTVTFLLGMAQPRGAWRWPLLVNLWVPILSLAGPWVGLAEASLDMPRTIPSYLGLTAFVIVIGLAGAYAGVLVRRTLGHLAGMVVPL